MNTRTRKKSASSTSSSSSMAPCRSTSSISRSSPMRAIAARPTCGQPLVEWQGKDGSRALFTWEEGIAYPTDQGGDDDVKLSAEDRMKYRLPTRFLIYSYDCENHHPIDAECEAPDGTWCKTKI